MFSVRLTIVLTAAATCAIATLHAQELPPYAPPAPPGSMTTSQIPGLDFSLQYPVEFTVQPTQDFLALMRQGHLNVYGSDPAKDPEHVQAEKCMHTLFYAISGKPVTSETTDTPDTLLVLDVDRTCIPKKIGDDKALSQLTGSMLSVPEFKPMVQQMWFMGGAGRRIHSGMAGTTFKVPSEAQGAPAREVTLAVAAASFVQKDHWIVVMYINGTQEVPIHKTFGFTSVVFSDNKPVLLYPFLLGSINLIK